MTEVTRVPLQPIAKGSLTKLWLGIIVAILVGAGIAWAAVPKSVSVETLTEGTGPAPELGQVVFVKYVGKLTDGTVFDESGASQLPPQLFPEGQPLLLEEGALIDGFIEGLQKTQKGGKYLIEIPAEKGYGATQAPGSPIPPNSDLVFGFLPKGLAYHAGYSIVAAIFWALVVVFAWPTHLEEWAEGLAVLNSGADFFEDQVIELEARFDESRLAECFESLSLTHIEAIPYLIAARLAHDPEPEPIRPRRPRTNHKTGSSWAAQLLATT